MRLARGCQLPSSACPTDQVKSISRYRSFIKPLIPLDTLHKLFVDDKLREAANASTISNAISNSIAMFFRQVSPTERG
jgi:hypothetical protein